MFSVFKLPFDIVGGAMQGDVTYGFRKVHEGFTTGADGTEIKTHGFCWIRQLISWI